MKPYLLVARRQEASALLIVMLLSAVAILILASTMRWTNNTAYLTERNIQYLDTVYAAEAATEKVVTEFNVDFARMGASVVNAKVPVYRGRIPKYTEHPYWGKFKFSNGKGKDDEVSVDIISPWQMSPLISQYQGLSGYAATYRIRANALDLTSRHDVSGAVQQDVQVALVPIYQFAIFYNMDMEVNPGARMNITGRAHGNANIYLQPPAPLTFLGDITSAGEIIFGKKPGDPVIRNVSSVTFNGEHDSGVMSLNLPICTNNSPETVREIVEIPPQNESANSDLGKQRFYNLADLVILVNGANDVEARGGGLGNGNGVKLKWSSISNFLRTDVSFYDQREKKTIKATEIDVAKFVTWNTDSKNALKNALQRDINSIYIADLRTQSANTEPGIRLVNGASLPPLGLTIATPDPLYVKGNYNAPVLDRGTTNTSNTKPAALVADSINILSGNWNDANSTKSLSARTASDTTVNASFLAGIVPTAEGYYSGGVENFPRFHENWSGLTFTYNGSIIVLFASVHGNAPWPGTGSVYNPPNRNWSFDLNFLNPDKLPPLCPSVRVVIRGQWSLINAKS